MWDVVVVGARCAGASTAFLLARRGYKVLLIDRAKFPADTMSTLYIHQPGLRLLSQWGILDSVIASGCPRIETVSYQVLDVRLHGPMARLGSIDAAYAPRRRILDQILVDAAVTAGAEFMDECSLTGVSTEDGRVTGAKFRTKRNGETTEQTHLLVGADGLHSRVAELVGAPIKVEDPLMTCIYYSGWTGISSGFEMRERPGSWIATVPTHDGVTLVLTYFPQDEFASIRTDPLKAHLESTRLMAPDLFDQMTHGEQVVRLHGTGNQRNFFRTANGPGWVLVGDAGHHEDSITARGITNAFVQAELLSDVLRDDMADVDRVDAALGSFADRRDAALTERYRSTLETAKLQVQNSRISMLKAISQTPAMTDRYFALAAGIISMDEFLTPDLIDMLYE
jgi:2-polyprenyl-6-methoxyphenol hydroxylase-like FAD-dependent oxidoreductase